MGKTIPYVGEFINSHDFPAPVRMARVTVGSASTNDVQVGDTGTYTLFTVPAGACVIEILSRVQTAFTASVTLAVGDSDAASGFLASSDVVPQSTGITLASSKTALATMSGGKIYDAAQDILLTVGAATVAAGLAEIFMVYALAGND
jgi:hypothetical protein